MFAIKFMDPYLFWIGVPAVALVGTALAWYSSKLIEGARKFFGELALLDLFTPRTAAHTRSLWAQWILFFAVLVAAAAGPNATDTPTLARAGALEVMYVFDVSPSMGAEDYRPYIKAAPGSTVPTDMYQWGTRLQKAVQIAENDFLPQLKDNKVGIVTVEGSGYNMWDLTRDHNGALKYMLDTFVRVGAAPGGGSDYVSGFKTALDEFKLEGKSGAERFIVLFTDGGFTGDSAALDKMLAELRKEKVHLLIVGMGGSTPITVPKYDPSTKQRNGAYDGTTTYQAQTLQHMVQQIPGAELIPAPPGKGDVSYNFPAKAGGLYAVPKQSNLYVWFLLADILLLLSITFGGGGLPRWKLVLPMFMEPILWLKSKLHR